jgi:hypothetical protein
MSYMYHQFAKLLDDFLLEEVRELPPSLEFVTSLNWLTLLSLFTRG